MRSFLIGAAAVALATSAAFAEPGKGNGGGGHQAGAGASHAGGGNPHNAGSKGGGGSNVAHGNGGGAKEAKGPSMHAAMAGPNGNSGANGKAKANADVRPAKHGNAAQTDHGNGKQADRGAPSHDDQRASRIPAVRGNGNDQGNGKIDDRRFQDDVRVVRRDDNRFRPINYDEGRHGLIDGCPPGLAKKHNGCMPPGLAKNGAYRDSYYRPSWFGYSSIGDGRYYYDNGYLYRMNEGGSVLGYLPLLGGALSVGNPWPSYYQPAPVPDYYVQYYNLGPQNGYRLCGRRALPGRPADRRDHLDRGPVDR